MSSNYSNSASHVYNMSAAATCTNSQPCDDTTPYSATVAVVQCEAQYCAVSSMQRGLAAALAVALSVCAALSAERSSRCQ
jgi:hypothetical protein